MKNLLFVDSSPFLSLAIPPSIKKIDPKSYLLKKRNLREGIILKPSWEELGITLSTPSEISQIANYVNAVRTGNLIFWREKAPSKPMVRYHGGKCTSHYD